MSTTTDLLPAPTQAKWLRNTLIAVASLEACYAILQSLKLLDPDALSANGHVAEQITITHLAAAPIFAVAAWVFAARDRLTQAIMALAAVVLTTWASEIMTAHLSGIVSMLAHVVRPIVAVLAITLAVRRTWLGFAAFLVVTMWILWFWVTFLSEFFPFVMGVLIYGA